MKANKMRPRNIPKDWKVTEGIIHVPIQKISHVLKKEQIGFHDKKSLDYIGEKVDACFSIDRIKKNKEKKGNLDDLMQKYVVDLAKGMITTTRRKHVTTRMEMDRALEARHFKDPCSLPAVAVEIKAKKQVQKKEEPVTLVYVEDHGRTYIPIAGVNSAMRKETRHYLPKAIITEVRSQVEVCFTPARIKKSGSTPGMIEDAMKQFIKEIATDIKLKIKMTGLDHVRPDDVKEIVEAGRAVCPLSMFQT